MTTRPDYYHVFGHMDNWLRDDQLTLEQRLNKRCDELAKAAVDVWIARRLARALTRSVQLLPFESVAVMVNGVKITGDIADAVRFARGKEEARKFLINSIPAKLLHVPNRDLESRAAPYHGSPDRATLGDTRKFVVVCMSSTKFP